MPYSRTRQQGAWRHQRRLFFKAQCRPSQQGSGAVTHPNAWNEENKIQVSTNHKAQSARNTWVNESSVEPEQCDSRVEHLRMVACEIWVREAKDGNLYQQSFILAFVLHMPLRYTYDLSWNEKYTTDKVRKAQNSHWSNPRFGIRIYSYFTLPFPKCTIWKPDVPYCCREIGLVSEDGIPWIITRSLKRNLNPVGNTKFGDLISPDKVARARAAD